VTEANLLVIIIQFSLELIIFLKVPADYYDPDWGCHIVMGPGQKFLTQVVSGNFFP